MNTLSCSLNTEIESLCGMAVNGMRPRRHVMALLLLERKRESERTYRVTHLVVLNVVLSLKLKLRFSI